MTEMTHATRSRPVDLRHSSVDGGFWIRFTALARETIIPYQWDVMNDRVAGVPPSGVMRNFRIAAGLEDGEFTGYRFQDSDFGKWLEAVAYRLVSHPDPALEALADEAIDLVVSTQDDDGYLNTFYTIKDRDKRWTDLRDMHEMYVSGHLLEAAVAYWEATGKRTFLDAMVRNIDHIGRLFGPEEGKRRGYPGHQELELALFRLYQVTGEKRHLELARFFLEERGRLPLYFERERAERGEAGKPHWSDEFKGEYYQVHRPLREQTEAVGHAVRVMYMASGAADVAAETGDDSLYDALRILWRNVVDRRMYVTGGVGSTGHGEAFTYDYDLPNETAYAETCAAIGLVFWARRMLGIEVRGEYGDVMERALYNGVLAGVSLDGKHFFYSNPLASHPHPRFPGRTLRPGWYGCACCPPNLARLLTSLGSYVYGHARNTLFVHLFAAGSVTIETEAGPLTVTQRTEYPREETVELTVAADAPRACCIAIRIPAWCRGAQLTINGDRVAAADVVRDGYAYLDRTWLPGDTVRLSLPMPVERVYAHPSVRAATGRVALQRGPLVYCLEEIDNGPALNALRLPRDAKVTAVPGRIGDLAIPFLHAEAEREQPGPTEGYCVSPPAREPASLTAVPYLLWANRGEGEMLVWIREN